MLCCSELVLPDMALEYRKRIRIMDGTSSDGDKEDEPVSKAHLVVACRRTLMLVSENRIN
jgi:hypothetical protein